MADELFVGIISLSDELFVNAKVHKLPRIVTERAWNWKLEPSKLIGPQQDVETVESWAERNGLTCSMARAWVYRGVLPTVKLGKRRMINSALLRSWLLEQEWTA